MKKLSLAKIIAALVIVNCYMFTCGVMGTVGDAQMLTEDTSEEHSETAAPAGDIDQAEGQGTLDFLVPDETGTGVVQINLLNMAPMSLSDKMVMSTYSALSDELPQPQEASVAFRIMLFSGDTIELSDTVLFVSTISPHSIPRAVSTIALSPCSKFTPAGAK